MLKAFNKNALEKKESSHTNHPNFWILWLYVHFKDEEYGAEEQKAYFLINMQKVLYQKEKYELRIMLR